MADEESDLVIAGGGPAGMMAALLFARAGVRTLVLEKHRDFLRDWLRTIPAAFLGFGIKAEHVRSPDARRGRAS